MSDLGVRPVPVVAQRVSDAGAQRPQQRADQNHRRLGQAGETARPLHHRPFDQSTEEVSSPPGGAMALVMTEIRERVAVVTLDDPPRRNALSLAMAEELGSLFRALASSTEVGAVVLTGAPPAFSAGADLDDLEQATPERLRRIYDGFLAVAGCPLPTIAAVNGPAVGAGLNLALACDVRLAGRGARFDSRFLALRLQPGGGHTFMLDRILGPQGAAALALLGEALDGEAAARHGLAWRCLDDDAVVAEAERMARRAAAAPGEFVRRLKATLRETAVLSRHVDAVELELGHQAQSATDPVFRQQLEELRRRIAARGGRS
jgi:enoyl-CoA hydratase